MYSPSVKHTNRGRFLDSVVGVLFAGASQPSVLDSARTVWSCTRSGVGLYTLKMASDYGMRPYQHLGVFAGAIADTDSAGVPLFIVELVGGVNEWTQSAGTVNFKVVDAAGALVDPPVGLIGRILIKQQMLSNTL